MDLQAYAQDIFIYCECECIALNTSVTYCRSGNIREVLIFERKTNSRIQELRENYYYNSAAKEK